MGKPPSNIQPAGTVPLTTRGLLTVELAAGVTPLGVGLALGVAVGVVVAVGVAVGVVLGVGLAVAVAVGVELAVAVAVGVGEAVD